MAIKVLVVDDEYLERALIRLGTDWTGNGFEIIGEAESGEEALKIIQKNKPDIVFTDICMPFMDGLELAEKICEKYEDIRIVIVTGHREFDYAQRALRLGVTDFLLKPINNEEVLSISLKIKANIEKERTARDGKNNELYQPNEGLYEKARTKRINALVEKAMAYIKENLSDPDLSLKSIARNLYVNESYLSRVFKQEMDEGITEYITKLRIDKSIEYINNTDLKAYAIAERIGISDPHYFSICFKKYTGKSINEFRKGK